jgi:hypothetical protein
MQSQRRDIIMQQRDKGVSGMMSGLSKINKEQGGAPKFNSGMGGFSGFGRNE